jgi:two-component system, cell cycle sensor histidine kinase and response regulator CckA
MVAASAQEALRICAQSGPEIRLILTDVVMPEMTGAELRDRIRALRPDIKVLFMSGYVGFWKALASLSTQVGKSKATSILRSAGRLDPDMAQYPRQFHRTTVSSPSSPWQ